MGKDLLLAHQVNYLLKCLISALLLWDHAHNINEFDRPKWGILDIRSLFLNVLRSPKHSIARARESSHKTLPSDPPSSSSPKRFSKGLYPQIKPESFYLSELQILHRDKAII